MAKQMGIFKVEGTLDDVTFYKTAEGFKIRMKGGVSADRIATDPAFVRTRENGAEFARAGKAGKLLRTALKGLLQNTGDSRLVSRLTTEMIKVVKADATSTRGMRNVIDGEVDILQGFEFNNNGKLTTCLYAPYDASIDRATGTCSVSIAPFVPAHMISAPGGCTHFKFITAATEVDFSAGSYVVDVKETPLQRLDNIQTALVSLETAMPASSVHPLFLALGVEFYQEVNGEQYPLNNGAFNALALVKVSGV